MKLEGEQSPQEDGSITSSSSSSSLVVLDPDPLPEISKNECSSLDSGFNNEIFSETEMISSGGSDSSSFSVQEQEPLLACSKKTLMIQITSTKARVTLVSEDGMMTPLQNEEQSGIYSTPLRVALINFEFFVFGPAVREYADRATSDPVFKSKTIFWDVGVLLQSPESIKKRTLIVNENFFNVPNELLAGLFLNYLKSVSEKHWDERKRIKKVILCVPLWFGSLQRQRLKDTAKIAGFEEITVVNEISTLALLHVASKNLAPDTPNNLLVLSENSGNIDLAFYSSLSGVSMKMVACTGNLYVSSSPAQNHQKNYYGKFIQKVDEKAVQKAGKYLLKSLKEELNKKLPEGMTQAPLDIILFCEDRRWKPILEQETNGLVTMYDHLGSPPIGLLKKNYWNPPSVQHSQLCGDGIEDLLPFGVFRSDEIYGKWCVPLMEKDVRACNGISFKSVTIYPTTETGIYQKNLLNEKFFVGIVKISSTVYFKYPKMEIECSMTKEGIIKLESVSACSENEKPIRMLETPEEYRWTPNNLKAGELEQCVGDLKEILRFSGKYKEKVSERYEALWDLCQKLAERIWSGDFQRGTGMEGKEALQKRVDKLLDKLRDTTNPLIEFDVITLEKYVTETEGYLSKYFS